MFGSLIDWINRAANKPTAHKATGEGGHDVPFDLTKHAPQFTAKDHEAARAQGYRDALDKFLWEMGGKLADEGARKRKLQSKAQMRADLEGEGLSTEELGGLSEEAARLPRYPHYEPKPEVHAPKDPYMRNAQVQGMVNRLIQLDERFRDHGVSLFDEEADVSPELREKYRWAQMERQRVAKRLVAFGEDPSEIEEGIQSGDLQRNMEIPAPDEASEDPDVRRVDAMYRAECEGLGRKEQKRAGEEAYRTAKEKADKRGGSTGAPGWGRRTEESSAGDAGRHTEYERHPQRGSRDSGGLKRPIKGVEIMLARERLQEIDVQLQDLGYVHGTGPILVKGIHRSAVEKLLTERETAIQTIAGWGEDVQEAEQWSEEQRHPHIIDDNGPGSSLERYVRSLQGDDGEASEISDTDEDPDTDGHESSSAVESDDGTGEQEGTEDDGTVESAWDMDGWDDDSGLSSTDFGGW